MKALQILAYIAREWLTTLLGSLAIVIGLLLLLFKHIDAFGLAALIGAGSSLILARDPQDHDNAKPKQAGKLFAMLVLALVFTGCKTTSTVSASTSKASIDSVSRIVAERELVAHEYVSALPALIIEATFNASELYHGTAHVLDTATGAVLELTRDTATNTYRARSYVPPRPEQRTKITQRVNKDSTRVQANSVDSSKSIAEFERLPRNQKRGGLAQAFVYVGVAALSLTAGYVLGKLL